MAILFNHQHDDPEQQELNWLTKHLELLGSLPTEDEITAATQTTDDGQGTLPPNSVPQNIPGLLDPNVPEGGLQVQEPQIPTAPTTEQSAVEDLQKMADAGSASTTAAELGREGQEQANSLIANAGAKRQALTEASQRAAQQALQQNKGGGLLGSLLKIGINTALGNWLGGVGSRALGTVGDAFNKAFKIKGIGAK